MLRAALKIWPRNYKFAQWAAFAKLNLNGSSMTRFDIPWEDNYVGRWIGEPSRVLTITKVGARRYLVSLTVNDSPVKRPWMDDEPTIDMPAEYTFDALDGADFVVNLWPPGRRFSLHLSYEPDFVLESRRREALTVGVSRDERLSFLDQYYDVLGGLDHFVREADNGE
jgi:hypothetical protein